MDQTRSDIDVEVGSAGDAVGTGYCERVGSRGSRGVTGYRHGGSGGSPRGQRDRLWSKGSSGGRWTRNLAWGEGQDKDPVETDVGVRAAQAGENYRGLSGPSLRNRYG